MGARNCNGFIAVALLAGVFCMGSAWAQEEPSEIQEIRKEFDKFRIWMNKNIAEESKKNTPPEKPLQETMLLTFRVDEGSEPVVIATAVPSYELKAAASSESAQYEVRALGRVQELETADVARAAFSGQPVPADQMPLLITCAGYYVVRTQEGGKQTESQVEFDASVIVRPGVESVLVKQGKRRLTVTVQLASRIPEAGLEEAE